MKTIWDVLKAPVITEKALWLKEESTKNIRDSKNKKTIKRDRQVLAFRVADEANKYSIKSAVETIFKVKVDQVRVVNYRGKTVRRGRTVGRKSDWKKAYVTLKPGNTIEYADTI
ncbi:MAG TPA: 50S ribosomal protein L23 [Blastocatellia bacterium]|nr:50S ribosomal protein L23 [Blastocatellia bacterium]HMV85124.1 50S ribosomal protein L23 [Blastocatellia bacterium]HMX25652.1 50S ribosomal protein L23 [Blastocatellia bacterium]HMY75151.1 50S ribosomal protein L23 [Blastocatellia bacterium]HMZ18629.1 50S ribosomal protein L23 [Blastocatellia bacterium]